LVEIPRYPSWPSFADQSSLSHPATCVCPRDPSIIPTSPLARKTTGFLGKKGWEMGNTGGPMRPRTLPGKSTECITPGILWTRCETEVLCRLFENAIIHGKAYAGREGCRVFCDMDNKLRVILDPSLSSVVPPCEESAKSG